MNWLNGYELGFGSGLGTIGLDPHYRVGSSWRSGFVPSGLSRPRLLACQASTEPTAGLRAEDERGRTARPVQVLTGFWPRVLRKK
jgi:alkylation response protein AidB-like acyl-CoA dehydrogenase